MRIIIAGGRDYKKQPSDFDWLTHLHRMYTFTTVISGAARGADLLGECWAKQNHIPIERFPANWNKYGRAAGMYRNAQMIRVADAVALFPGDKGTANMRELAELYNRRIFTR